MLPISEKQKDIRQIIQLVLHRRGKMCNFLEWKNLKIVYKRYASLYFTFVVDSDDNELIALEIIHRYVTILGLFWFFVVQKYGGNFFKKNRFFFINLDTYFGTVCELDIVYNFEKAHFILDEVLIAGELQDTSKIAPLVEVRMADAMIPDAEQVTSMTVIPSPTTSVISHFEF